MICVSSKFSVDADAVGLAITLYNRSFGCVIGNRLLGQRRRESSILLGNGFLNWLCQFLLSLAMYGCACWPTAHQHCVSVVGM